jgi:tetratricopeptide (TPR) repeat protein
VGAVALAVYLGTLAAGFVWDDRFQIVQNPVIKDLRFVPRFFTTGVWTLISPDHPTNYYRPLQFVSYLGTYQLFGLSAPAFHLVNVVLNVLVTLMVYAVARRLFRRDDVALTTGLLFAVHPAHTEAVAWLASVPELLMCLFYLLAFYSYVRAGAAGDAAARWRLASLVAFALALLSKEMALTLPLLLVLQEHGVARSGLRQGVRRYAAYFAVAGAYLGLRTWALGGLAPVEKLADMTLSRFVLSDIVLMGQYWWTLVVPVKLNAFHVFVPSDSVLDGRVLLAAGTLAALGVLMVGLARAGSALWLPIAWVVVTLLPVLYIKGVGANVFAERYLYLPSVGFSLALAAAFHALTRKLSRPLARAARGALALLLVLLSIQTVRRAEVWKDEIALFTDTLARSPSVYPIRNFLGIALLEEGRLSQAREQFVANQTLDPDNEQGFRNEAAVDLKEGRLDEAATAYRRAVQRKPDDPSLHQDLGVVLLRKGDRGGAIPEFEEALRLNPGLVAVHTTLGEIYLQTGAVDLAIRHHLAAMSAAPTAAGHFALGYLFARKGSPDLAVKHYQEAIRLNPRHAEAHNNLGALYLQQRRLDDALREFEEAVSANPVYPEALNNLGTAYYHKGRMDQAIEQYTKALAIAPGYTEARDNLERVRRQRGPEPR